MPCYKCTRQKQFALKAKFILVYLSTVKLNWGNFAKNWCSSAVSWEQVFIFRKDWKQITCQGNGDFVIAGTLTRFEPNQIGVQSRVAFAGVRTPNAVRVVGFHVQFHGVFLVPADYAVHGA